MTYWSVSDAANSSLQWSQRIQKTEQTIRTKDLKRNSTWCVRKMSKYSRDVWILFNKPAAEADIIFTWTHPDLLVWSHVSSVGGPTVELRTVKHKQVKGPEYFVFQCVMGPFMTGFRTWCREKYYWTEIFLTKKSEIKYPKTLFFSLPFPLSFKTNKYFM